MGKHITAEYHKITPAEIKAFNARLPAIHIALNTMKKSFIGKKKLYLYVVGNKEIKLQELSFSNRHFMHLCGVKYSNGAKGFINDLNKKRLNLNLLSVKSDGTTFQKLQIIDQIDRLDSLQTQISIGNNMASIHYDSLLKTKERILGIAIKKDANDKYIPLSLLNLSVKDNKSLTSFEVIAILEENEATKERSCVKKREDCPQK